MHEASLIVVWEVGCNARRSISPSRIGDHSHQYLHSRWLSIPRLTQWNRHRSSQTRKSLGTLDHLDPLAAHIGLFSPRLHSTVKTTQTTPRAFIPLFGLVDHWNRLITWQLFHWEQQQVIVVNSYWSQKEVVPYSTPPYSGSSLKASLLLL
jgi:hypothetical protein